ncbi:hypothetical protein GCM10027160_10670 [Streptomyces calidiresistens]
MPQLRECPTAGVADGRQPLAGAFRRGREQELRRVGLDHHARDVVGDHVVQFAGDAAPLPTCDAAGRKGRGGLRPSDVPEETSRRSDLPR